jgi:hypothetical protein
MIAYTWRGVDCLIVPPIKESRCLGCMFATTPDEECPHTDPDSEITCDGVDNDNICIEDTPEAIAEYMAERLT